MRTTKLAQNRVDNNMTSVAYPGILFRGVQQIKLRTEDRKNGDLGMVAS